MENELFKKLAELYGNHSRVARAAGMDPRQYRRIRGYAKLTPAMECYLQKILDDKDKEKEKSNGRKARARTAKGA